MNEPWKIPENWRWSTMGEVADIVGGGTPRSDQDEYFGGQISWVTPADLSDYTDKFISAGARSITQAGLDNSGARVMPAGSVLFSSRAPIGYVAIASNPVSTNQGFKSFVLRDGLTPDFVYYYLQHAKKLAVSLASGTTFLEISGKKAAQIPIPIPPLPEQRRLVAEIEKQFTRLDAGVAALRRTQANLRRYRASVIEDTLAVDWPKMQVSEIGEVVTGTTPSTAEDDNYGGYLPFVTPADLNAGYYLKSATRHLSSKGAGLARPLPQGAVLVTCIGATIGKTGLARFPCATNQQINAFIPHDMAVSPEWAFWMFSSPSGQRQIRENASATTLPILNKTRFGMLRIPVPPLAVQAQLVGEIERRLTIADAIQKTLGRCIMRGDRLRQTLLEAAFTGRLIIT